jgi:glutamate synthase (NADPH/NADH) small chain
VDLKNDRTDESNIVITERVSNYNEFTIPLAKDKIKEQGSRCMDCGICFAIVLVH